MYLDMGVGLAVSDKSFGAQGDFGFGAILKKGLGLGVKASLTDHYVGPQVEFRADDLIWRLGLRLSAGAAWQLPSRTCNSHGDCYASRHYALSENGSNIAEIASVERGSNDPDAMFSSSIGIGIRLYKQLELTPAFSLFTDGNVFVPYGTLTLGCAIPL
jgi:hypothetical protein